MPGPEFSLASAYVELSSRGPLAEQLARAKAQAEQLAQSLSANVSAAAVKAAADVRKIQAGNNSVLAASDQAVNRQATASPEYRRAAAREQMTDVRATTDELGARLARLQARAVVLATPAGTRELEKQAQLLRQIADAASAVARAQAPVAAQQALTQRSTDAAAQASRIDATRALAADPAAQAARANEVANALKGQTDAVVEQAAKLDERNRLLASPGGRAELQAQAQALARVGAELTARGGAAAAGGAGNRAADELNRRLESAQQRAAAGRAGLALADDPRAKQARGLEAAAGLQEGAAGLHEQLRALQARNALLASPEGTRELQRQLDLTRRVTAELLARARNPATSLGAEQKARQEINRQLQDEQDRAARLAADRAVAATPAARVTVRQRAANDLGQRGNDLAAEAAALQARNRLLASPEGRKELEAQWRLQRQIAAERGNAQWASASPMDRFRTATDAVRGGLQQAAAAMQQFATVATVGGAVSAAAIQHAVAIGAPAVMWRWSQATRDLTGVLGQSLAPMLDRVTAGVRGVANWVAGLSQGARRFGVAVAVGGVAAVAAFGAATVAVTILTGAFGLLALASNTALGGIPAILGGVAVAAGAVVGALAGTVAFAGGMVASTKGGWETLTKLAARLGDAVKPVLAVLGGVWSAVERGVARVGPLIERLAAAWQPVIDAVKNVAAGIAAYWETDSGLVEAATELWSQFGSVVGDVVMPALAALGPVIELIAGRLERLVYTLGAVAKARADATIYGPIANPLKLLEGLGNVPGNVDKKMAEVEERSRKIREAMDKTGNSFGAGGFEQNTEAASIETARQRFVQLALTASAQAKSPEEKTVEAIKEGVGKQEQTNKLLEQILRAYGWRPSPAGG